MRDKLLTIFAGLVVLGLLYLAFGPEAKAQPLITFDHYLITPEGKDLWKHRVYGPTADENEVVKRTFEEAEVMKPWWILLEDEGPTKVCHTWLMITDDLWQHLMTGMIDDSQFRAMSMIASKDCAKAAGIRTLD